MRIYHFLLLSIFFFSSLVRAESTAYTWVEGELQAIYSCNHHLGASDGCLATYYLTLTKLKMIRLDMSKIDKSNNWRTLIDKIVEIKITKSNESKVKSGELSYYTVLDIRYKPTTQTKTSKIKHPTKTTFMKTNVGEQSDKKKPWKNLLCKFPDIADVPHNSDFYQTMFGNTYPYLEHYWKETTYGHIDISGTETIGDWVTLPHDHSHYKPAGEEEADIGKLREDCINAAGMADTLDQYFGVNLFFNGNIFDRWRGKGGGFTTWINLFARNNLGTIAHEMGHVYGLAHSSGRYGNEYDSPWDVMSDAHRGDDFGAYRDIAQHTIAFHKQKLGAITTDYDFSNASYDTNTGETFHLSRQEEQATSGDYLIANVKSADGTKHYTVEARDKIGYDSSLPTKAVIIHEIEDDSRAYVVDPDNNGDLSDAGAQWQAGETFTDTNHSISIEVLSETSTGFNVRITAPRAKPTAVRTISGSEDLMDRIHVNWSPSSGAEYYKVLRYDSWDLTSDYEEFTTEGNTTFFDDVPEDTKQYIYRVKACNTVGCSLVSDSLFGFGRRAAVTDINASTNLGNKVHITWSTFTGAEYYKVLRYDSWDLTSPYREFTTDNNDTFYDDVPDDAKYYYYRVKACKSDGCSIVSKYSPGSRAFVLDINATSDLADKVYVSWTAFDGAEYYKVLRYDSWDLTSPYREFTTDNNDTFYDDVPEDLKRYYYRVKACNAAGCSLTSQYVYGKGQRTLEIEASDGTYNDKVIINFSSLGSGNNYVLFRSTEGASISVSRVSGTESPLVDNFLERNVKYEYFVSVYDSNGSYLGSSIKDTGYKEWDSDGDGVADLQDAFPDDMNETLDTDGDGTGNNEDSDDDGDGINDSDDAFPLDSAESIDTDDDGIGNNADSDDDGDGFADVEEIEAGTDPLDSTSYPQVIGAEYNNTSFYVAYDSEDTTQFVLVLPSVQKVYTHKAGDILNLTRVDTDLVSFPTYTDGTLCFPSLASGVSETTTASVMAKKCYEVKFFYTQKESTVEGTAFILYYKPSEKVYEGLAGKADTFKVVKEGDNIANENSITGDDYTNFSFDIKSSKAYGLKEIN